MVARRVIGIWGRFESFQHFVYIFVLPSSPFLLRKWPDSSRQGPRVLSHWKRSQWRLVVTERKSLSPLPWQHQVAWKPSDRQTDRTLGVCFKFGAADVWIDRLFPLRRERAVPMATRPAAAAGRYCEIRKTQTRKYLEGSRQLGHFLLAFIAT